MFSFDDGINTFYSGFRTKVGNVFSHAYMGRRVNDGAVLDFSGTYYATLNHIENGGSVLDMDVDELMEVLCKGDSDEIYEITISPDILNCINCDNIQWSVNELLIATYYGHILYIDDTKNRYIKLTHKITFKEYIVNLDETNDSQCQEDIDIDKNEFDMLLRGEDISSKSTMCD